MCHPETSQKCVLDPRESEKSIDKMSQNFVFFNGIELRTLSLELYCWVTATADLTSSSEWLLAACHCVLD